MVIRREHQSSSHWLASIIVLAVLKPDWNPILTASIDMAVANQVNRLVNGASERIMSVFSGLHIVEAEGSNATPQVPSSQRMRPHTMHLPVRILDNPRSRLYSKTVHAKKGMTDITDVFHLGRSIHQDHEAHRHLLQNHPRLIRVPK